MNVIYLTSKSVQKNIKTPSQIIVSFFIASIIMTAYHSFGQDSYKKFSPIYFTQNSDTIEVMYNGRLDSIGKYLQSDTTLVLKIHSYGNPVENPFNKIVSNRAQNVINYLTTKFKVKIQNYYLTNDNNRGVVGRPDDDYSENEKASLRKVEFTFTRSPG